MRAGSDLKVPRPALQPFDRARTGREAGRRLRVACVGECMLELRMPVEGFAGSAVSCAGDTFNTAVYLCREALDVDVAYVTALGSDPLSDRMVAAMAQEGLDVSLVERRSNRRPGLYAIALDAAGERSFAYWRAESAARTLFIPPTRVPARCLLDFDLVYLSGITLAVLSQAARNDLLATLEEHRSRGGLVAFDTNHRPALWPDRGAAIKAVEAVLRVTDVILTSLDDEVALHCDRDADAVLARLRGYGIGAGALKCGADGPLPLDRTAPAAPYPPAPSVVDTTAAGDSFNGGYLAAFLAGRPEAACMLAGHALAVHVIGCTGAIASRR